MVIGLKGLIEAENGSQVQNAPDWKLQASACFQKETCHFLPQCWEEQSRISEVEPHRVPAWMPCWVAVARATEARLQHVDLGSW